MNQENLLLDYQIIEKLWERDCDDPADVSRQMLENSLQYAEELIGEIQTGRFTEFLSTIAIFNLVAKFFERHPKEHPEILERYIDLMKRAQTTIPTETEFIDEVFNWRET